MAYFFTPPTVLEGPAGGGILFFRYRLNRANTILEVSLGVYESIRTPGIDECTAALNVYQGGHKSQITLDQRTRLINAGYGPYITEE
jgi:hypothetical protein